jgi:hypothetical protein
MNARYGLGVCILAGAAAVLAAADPAPLAEALNTWVKRSPLQDGPPSPGLSYETSLAYDPLARRVLRWGGHAQGGVKGSGEQITEIWALDQRFPACGFPHDRSSTFVFFFVKLTARMLPGFSQLQASSLIPSFCQNL